jgi:hypothetical protein
MPRIENGGGGFLAAFLSPKVFNIRLKHRERSAAPKRVPIYQSDTT